MGELGAHAEIEGMVTSRQEYLLQLGRYNYMTDENLLPRVSVLMPVYNGEKYLVEAVDSILNQTYRDFEFIIINDGSNDNTDRILCRYQQQDKRIRIINHERNQGLISSLNEGIDMSRGEYIARMDCDDISLPLRFQKQVEFMDQHREVAICGTWFKTFGLQKRTVCYPVDSKEICCTYLFSSAIGHPTVIIRTEVFRNNRVYYDPLYAHAEDFELWSRCSRSMLIANIPEVMLLYRIHSDGISVSKKDTQWSNTLLSIKGNLNYFGFNYTPTDLDTHSKLIFCVRSGFDRWDEESGIVLTWVQKLISANKSFERDLFRKVIEKYWFLYCYYNHSAGWKAMKTYICFSGKVRFLMKGRMSVFFLARCTIAELRRRFVHG